MGYTNQALKGSSWITILRVTTRGLAFLKTLILARILVPQQFGAFGIAVMVLGFIELMTETGVNVILIQEKNHEKYIDSAWLVSIVRGALISIIIFLLAPTISNFFNSPESEILLYTISIVPLLRGFINPAIVKFQKNLDFKKEFYYRFSIFMVDTVFTVILTYIFKSPIGVVYGLIVGVLFEIVLSHMFVRPIPRVKLDSLYIKMIINKGKWITASGIFNYLFHNLDNVIIGRILGVSALGVYQVGYSFSILPITEVSEIVSKVTLPVFSKISEEKLRLRKAFIKTLLMISLVVIPFGILVTVFPKEIVLIIFGEKWLKAADILPVLVLFAIIRSISGFSSTLFYAVGKQKYVTVVTMVSVITLLLTIFPLVNKYGILGGALAALIGALVSVPIMFYFTWKLLK